MSSSSNASATTWLPIYTTWSKWLHVIMYDSFSRLNTLWVKYCSNHNFPPEKPKLYRQSAQWCSCEYENDECSCFSKNLDE